jgi:putative ABC transport system permease protein
MNPREFLRTAWESIRKNKLRSFLTMLGIIIGTASVIIMVAAKAAPMGPSRSRPGVP